jgi:hypothetical protein
VSTPERGRRRTDLFDERVRRLRWMLDHGTRYTIAESARLVYLSHHNNSPIRLIRAEIARYVAHLWHMYPSHWFWLGLCRLNVWHWGQRAGVPCPFCDKEEELVDVRSSD